MAGLDVAASVVGIASATLQTVQFLSTTIANIRDAPSTIQNIRADLQAVEPVLQQLDSALQGDVSQLLLGPEIRFSLENCDRACKVLHQSLDNWTKPSSAEANMVWTNKWRVGIFGQERIKVFKGQLNDCKNTLSVALSTATVIKMTRQESLMNEMKDMLLRQTEASLGNEIARASSERTDIETALQQLTVRRGAEPSEELESLLREMRHQQRSNDAFRTACEEALSKATFERTGQTIRGVRATNSSVALVGFVNTSGEQTKITQDISDVVSDTKSIAMVGVVQNVDFSALWPRHE